MQSTDRKAAVCHSLLPHNVAKPESLSTHTLDGREVCTVAKPHGPGFSAHMRVTPGVWLRAEGETRAEALAQLQARVNELRRLLK